MTARYRLHGLEIDSEILLPEPVHVAQSPPDVVISAGPAEHVEPLDDDASSIRFEIEDTVVYEGRLRGHGRGFIQIPARVELAVEGRSLQVQLGPEASQGGPASSQGVLVSASTSPSTAASASTPARSRSTGVPSP